MILILGPVMVHTYGYHWVLSDLLYLFEIGNSTSREVCAVDVGREMKLDF